MAKKDDSFRAARKRLLDLMSEKKEDQGERKAIPFPNNDVPTFLKELRIRRAEAEKVTYTLK